MKEIQEIKHLTKLMLNGLKYGYYFFILIFIFMLIFGNYSIVLGNGTSYNYTWNESELYNDVLPEPIANWNIRNQTKDCLYNATFTFLNESVGSNPDSTDWYIIDDDGGTILIYNELDGHCKVVGINNTNEYEYSAIYHSIYENEIYGKENGTIQFWMYSDDVSKDSGIQLIRSAPNKFLFYIESNYFKYFDDSGVHNIVSASIDTWYHISLEFDCSDDWFNVSINGIEYGSYSARGTPDIIYDIEFFSGTTSKDYLVYFDGIGLTNYKGYILDDNIEPLEYITNIIEPDKWEFTFNSTADSYPLDTNEIEGWTISETGGTCKVSEFDGFNRAIKLQCLDGTCNTYMYRTMNIPSTNNTIINTTLYIPFNYAYFTEFFYFYLTNETDDTITEIIINYLSLKAYISESLEYSEVITPYIPYSIDLSFRFVDNLMNIYINESLIASNSYLGNTVKSFYLKGYTYTTNVDKNEYYIDYVGIYSNGLSDSTEITPENIYPIGIDWTYQNHYFIEFTFNNTFANNITIYLNDDSILYDYSTERWNRKNIYNESTSYYNLFFRITNDSLFEITNLYIHGVKLTDGIENYYINLDYSYVDLNESYFYVSNNRLYYTFTSNDSENEYLKAVFNIDNLASRNYYIAFSHIKDNVDLYSYFNLYFTSTYLQFPSYTYLENINTMLPQDKLIQYFEFVITDNDNDVNDINTGYFSNIRLIYYPDLDTTFTLVSLLELIPLLIILVIIPLAIYYGFGKRITVLVPSILLMSIFAVAQGLLPLWIAVIVWFSCISYYVIKRGLA